MRSLHGSIAAAPIVHMRHAANLVVDGAGPGACAWGAGSLVRSCRRGDPEATENRKPFLLPGFS